MRILELVEIQPFLAGQAWCGTGRPPHSRVALARAFIAKAVWNIPTTRGLIDYVSSSPSLRRLCGWNSVSGIPHESVFSRAFELFALRELPKDCAVGTKKNSKGYKESWIVYASSATALTGLRVLSFAGCFPLSWRPTGSLRLFHRRQGFENFAKVVGWIDAELAAGLDEAVDDGASLA